MPKHKPLKHPIQIRRWRVQLTNEQMIYLCAPMKRGESRMGAYLQLLKCAADTPRYFRPAFGQPIRMAEGELVIHVTDLAARWQWSRDTVRKFIDQLEWFGLLTRTSLDRCALLRMTMTWPDDIPPFDSIPFIWHKDLPQELIDQFDAWLCDELSDGELLRSIGDFLGSSPDADGQESPFLGGAIQFEMIRRLFRMVLAPEIELPSELDVYVFRYLRRIFDWCLAGSWEEWLAFIREAKRLNLLAPRGSELGDASPTFIKCQDHFISLLIYLRVIQGS